jgi:hypothetical protein
MVEHLPSKCEAEFKLQYQKESLDVISNVVNTYIPSCSSSM